MELVFFWQEDPTLEKHFKGHRDAVTSVDFNPNMKQLGMVCVCFHTENVESISQQIFKTFLHMPCSSCSHICERQTWAPHGPWATFGVCLPVKNQLEFAK